MQTVRSILQWLNQGSWVAKLYLQVNDAEYFHIPIHEDYSLQEVPKIIISTGELTTSSKLCFGLTTAPIKSTGIHKDNGSGGAYLHSRQISLFQ